LGPWSGDEKEMGRNEDGEERKRRRTEGE